MLQIHEERKKKGNQNKWDKLKEDPNIPAACEGLFRLKGI